MKKLIAIALSILLCFSLFACGKSDTSDTPTENTVNSETNDKADSQDAITRPVNAGKFVDLSENYTVALKNDGTVFSTGVSSLSYVFTGEWTDIVAVSAGAHHIVALKSDGTVVATGLNNEGQCNVKYWTDIKEIRAVGNKTYGVKLDGTVLKAIANTDYTEYAVNGFENIDRLCDGGFAISEDDKAYMLNNNSGPVETNVRNIAYNNYAVVLLKKDGTVSAYSDPDNKFSNEISKWSDITDVATGYLYTVGVRSDGTVLAAGQNTDGQCDVSEWTDIVDVSCGRDFTVGLKADGTVVATGFNGYGQCNVSEWSDIVAIFTDSLRTIGLKADGTLVATGLNNDQQCNVSTWKDIKIR
ncbi:MAG: chromosome condensation regulator [Clostridia bacterium]|nr:chromosome condensation regulator [Clostridia bacterium]